MKRSLTLAGALGLLAVGATAQERKTVRVEFEALTAGQALSAGPILAHREGLHLWALGQKASTGIQVLAEDGNTEWLLAEAVVGMGQGYGDAVAVIPTLPRQGRAAEITVTPTHPMVSAAWMLGMTNDGFAGLDAVNAYALTEPLTIDLLALDAGTEVNDELKASVPALGGLGRAPENGVIDHHTGVRGDADAPAEWRFDPAAPVVRVRLVPGGAASN